MSIVNVLFYGNCQVYAILKILNLPKKYNLFHIECWKNNIDEEYFRNTIINSDIIITQPIKDNYRDVNYLSTSYIIKHKNNNCILLLFDSCYFNFYYFDLTYKNFNNNLLRKPIDYHYNKMIECYNNNNSIEHYITKYVNNLDLKTYEELDELAQNSLNELHNRYIENKEKYNENNIFIISTYEYIKDNYKDKLLFYSMNHPSKYVLQYLCEKINNILQIPNTINYDIDPLNNPRCILYKCISKNVHFDVNNDNVLTLNNKDIIQITQMYFDTYKEIDFM